MKRSAIWYRLRHVLMFLKKFSFSASGSTLASRQSYSPSVFSIKTTCLKFFIKRLNYTFKILLLA